MIQALKKKKVHDMKTTQIDTCYIFLWSSKLLKWVSFVFQHPFHIMQKLHKRHDTIFFSKKVIINEGLQQTIMEIQ